MSLCLELLDQADSMSKALQLVLAEAADYWKVERVWLAELSPGSFAGPALFPQLVSSAVEGPFGRQLVA